MQVLMSRSAPSEMQQKSSSPSVHGGNKSSSSKATRGSSVSADYYPSKIPNSQASKQKQRNMRVSEMQPSQLREELKRAKAELAELKKRTEESAGSNERIKMLEAEAEKANASEMKMLESLFSQTKQLEQTKISFEEAKLEIRNLQHRIGSMETSAGFTSRLFEKYGSLAPIQRQDEIKKLRNELRLVLEAEEKSKKAMDVLSIALAEVTAEATHAKADLVALKPELEKSRTEAAFANASSKSTEQNLQESLKAYDKLKLEYEESTVAWKAREDGLKNCIMISEEDIAKKDQENSRLSDVHKMAMEENFKLRDIIKQAVNEATVAKESMEIARRENGELKEQLSKKENDLQQLRQDYESLKVRVAAGLDSVKELKSSLAPDFADNSKEISYLPKDTSLKASSFRSDDDRKITKGMKNRHSSRWSNENPRVHSSRWSNQDPRVPNGHHNGLDLFNGLAFDKDGSFECKDKKRAPVSVVPQKWLPPDVFREGRVMNRGGVDPIDVEMLPNAEIEKQKKKKKKTVFERFGDSLRRKSFLKP